MQNRLFSCLFSCFSVKNTEMWIISKKCQKLMIKASKTVKSVQGRKDVSLKWIRTRKLNTKWQAGCLRSRDTKKNHCIIAFSAQNKKCFKLSGIRQL